MIYGINSEKESKKSEMHLSRCKLLFHLKDSEVHEWRHSNISLQLLQTEHLNIIPRMYMCHQDNNYWNFNIFITEILLHYLNTLKHLRHQKTYQGGSRDVE